LQRYLQEYSLNQSREEESAIIGNNQALNERTVLKIMAVLPFLSAPILPHSPLSKCSGK